MTKIKVHRIKEEGFENYRITETGRIWSKHTKKFMKPKTVNGYLIASTSTNKEDNSVKNLKWCKSEQASIKTVKVVKKTTATKTKIKKAIKVGS